MKDKDETGRAAMENGAVKTARKNGYADSVPGTLKKKALVFFANYIENHEGDLDNSDALSILMKTVGGGRLAGRAAARFRDPGEGDGRQSFGGIRIPARDKEQWKAALRKAEIAARTSAACAAAGMRRQSAIACSGCGRIRTARRQSDSRKRKGRVGGDGPKGGGHNGSAAIEGRRVCFGGVLRQRAG